MKKLLLNCLTTAAIAAIGLAAPRASATVTVYTDSAMYAAATKNNTAYALSGGTNSGIDEGTSYTKGPVTFSISSGEFLLLLDEGIYGPGVSYLRADSFGNGLTETLTLPSPATAIAFTLGTYNGAFTTIVVNGAIADTFTGSSTGPGTTFVGCTSTVPITSLTFGQPMQQGVSALAIDTISFQVGSAVPEPSTWALLGVSAVGVAALRRRAL